MSRKKNFYYVLVMTSNGPVFVTEILPNQFARFDKNSAPMKFATKEMAQEMSVGLMWNGHMAYCVASSFELNYQPYPYERGKFQWVDIKEVEKNA